MLPRMNRMEKIRMPMKQRRSRARTVFIAFLLAGYP
jgi:hypothetical protein